MLVVWPETTKEDDIFNSGEKYIKTLVFESSTKSRKIHTKDPLIQPANYFLEQLVVTLAPYTWYEKRNHVSQNVTARNLSKCQILMGVR